jgi:hypothetical protein
MFRPLLRYYILASVFAFTVTDLSTAAEEETGTSAVPLYKGTPKPPTPAPTQPPVQKPVRSLGKIKGPPLPAASKGVIYGVTTNGDLMWYRHDGRADGSFRWAAPQGEKVGTGWTFKDVFSGEEP